MKWWWQKKKHPVAVKNDAVMQKVDARGVAMAKLKQYDLSPKERYEALKVLYTRGRDLLVIPMGKAKEWNVTEAFIEMNTPVPSIVRR